MGGKTSFLKQLFPPLVYVQNDQPIMGIILSSSTRPGASAVCPRSALPICLVRTLEGGGGGHPLLHCLPQATGETHCHSVRVGQWAATTRQSGPPLLWPP